MSKRLILLVLILLVVGACTTPTATPTNVPQTNTPAAARTDSPSPSPSPVEPTATRTTTNTPAPKASPTPAAYGPGPDDYPENVNPLTGLVVKDPKILDRRPLSVKIQIFPRGQRPPWGISLADLVYDYYQNNGLTRFHAVFYGNDAEQVGPIRSARLFDRHVVKLYKSVFAFGGADRRIYSRILDSTIAGYLVVEGNGNCPPMCRIDPNGFNYLVTNTEDLSQYATDQGMDNVRQDLYGMSFAGLTPEGGQAGKQIFVRTSISAYTRWDYDPDSGKYLRFQDTQEDTTGGQDEAYAELTDRLTDEQVTADNVVVLFLPHEYFYRSKSGNSEIVDILLNGKGNAFAFRDGQIFQVEWNRNENAPVLYLTFPNDEQYSFKPGNTWFQVIGTSSTMETESGIWRFLFKIP